MKPIVIIGGGVVGSATAYHLAMSGAAGDTVVIEPDPTYEWAATPRSTGGVRIQFSLPELIHMSLYGHEVYGSFATLMAVNEEPGVMDLNRRGYLYLGQGAEDVERFEIASRMQTAAGANIALLDADEVRARWPSVEVEDVDVASFSPDDAIIDPYAAVVGIRKKALSLGVEYRQDRVVDFAREAKRVNRGLPGVRYQARLRDGGECRQLLGPGALQKAGYGAPGGADETYDLLFRLPRKYRRSSLASSCVDWWRVSPRRSWLHLRGITLRRAERIQLGRGLRTV